MKPMKRIICVVMPALAFGCFLFSQSGYAQCPEVCDNNQNTGFGVAALPAVNGGTGNTAIGNDALASTTSGRYNTAVGEGALTNNTVDGNTAIGDEAMIRNTIGLCNVAVGQQALDFNTTGNTAAGVTCSTVIELATTTRPMMSARYFSMWAATTILRRATRPSFTTRGTTMSV